MNQKKKPLSKLNLSITPSPLVKMKGLAQFLNVPHIYIKRDDLLGKILGGNKLRKLEYILPAAIEDNADTLITTGSFESNHAALTSVAAKILGLQAVIVLMGPKNQKYTPLNMTIQERLGAEIRKVFFTEGNNKSRETLSDRVSEQVEKLTNDLKSRGRKPFFVPAAGCCLEGTYAFVEAFKELDNQMQQAGCYGYDIILALGTGSTFAGLWCGARLADADVKICGISIARKKPRCIQETITAAQRVCDLLKIAVPRENELNITDQYIGDGYAKPTAWSERAIKIALETEGLLLDHTYTGKALGGMLELIEKKQLGSRPLVFWHTGGVSGAVDAFEHSQQNQNKSFINRKSYD